MNKAKIANRGIIHDIFLIIRLFLKVDCKKSIIYLNLKIINLIISSIFSVSLIIFPKYFVNAITEEKNFQIAIYILCGYAAIRFFISLLGNLVIYKSNVVVSDINTSIEKKLLYKASQIQYEQFENTEYYDKYTKASQYVKAGSDSVIGIFFDFCETLVAFLTASVIIGQLHILALILLLLLIAIKYFVRKKIDNASIKVRDEMTRIQRKNGYLVSILSKKDYIKDIKITNSIEFLCEKFQQHYEVGREKRIKLNKKRILLGIPSSIIEILFVSALYLTLGNELFNSSITLGDYSAAISAATLLSSQVQLMLNNITSFRNYHYNLNCFYDFMNYETNSLPPFPDENITTIAFHHVSYRYPGQDEYAIKDISFCIDKGDKIAIVGQNGAGKTTIIHLLLGLLIPTEGYITVNGLDVKLYNCDNLYKNISVVFQNHCEYAFTIAENVLMHDCTSVKDQETVFFSLKKAGLIEKINKTSLGIMTPLSRLLDDNGMDFSGGEHQRIAIARAYAKKSNFIILDEPASSLDPIAEHQLCNDLLNLSENKTVIMISHRLLTAKNAEKIIVVDSGNIVDVGSHETLMKKNSLYSKMYKLQNEK